MSRMNTTDLIKFRRLQRTIGDSTAHTLGHLEMIWNWAHQNAYTREGPPLRPGDVEIAADWDGDDGMFERAMIDCGWLDRGGDGLLYVHDFWDNCPSVVKRRIVRSEQMDTQCPTNDKPMDTQCPTKMTSDGHKTAILDTNGSQDKDKDEDEDEDEDIKKENTDPPNPPSGGTPNGAACDAITDGTVFAINRHLLERLPASPHGPDGEPLTREQLRGLAELVARDTPPESLIGVLPGIEPPQAPIEAPRPASVNTIGFQLVAAWNKMAAANGLPKCEAISKKRTAAIAERAKDAYFVEHWKDAIEKIPSIGWMLGNNNRQWKANVDYFLRPDSVTKIMEYEPNKRNDMTITDDADWMGGGNTE